MTAGEGKKRWTKIADEINTLLYQGEAMLNGRQCRNRWINKFDEGLNK
jgi:hypothetical protein